MKRRVMAPLLITGCDCCQRRRACAPFRDLGLWLCRQCIQRFEGACFLARLALQRQGR